MENFVIKECPEFKLSWGEFESLVSNINEPRKMLNFLLSRTFSKKEFFSFLDRVDFMYSNMKKEFFTDNVLFTSCLLFRILRNKISNLDYNDYLSYKEKLDSDKNIPEISEKDFINKKELFQRRFAYYIDALNTLLELKANETDDPDELYKLLVASLDPMKFDGFIANKMNYSSYRI